MTHAGFWVDGAVRKPEAKHADEENEVLVKTKSNVRVPFLETFSDVTDECIWLDTTPRESLTPEELFSVLKMLWPDVKKVIAFSDDCWYVNDGAAHTPIAWNGATQYPPFSEPQWVRITRENVGQYLFRECRFRDVETQEWRNGRVSGWDEQDGCCLVNSDFEEEMPIMQWCIVEVQNALTS